MAQMCWVGIPDWFNQNLGFSVPFTCVVLFAPPLMSLPSSPDSSHFSKKSEEVCLCERVLCGYEARSLHREVVKRCLSDEMN